MARGIWKGNITFGLVNIPVSLHPGVSHNPMDFTLIDKRNNAPVGYRKVNKKTGEEEDFRRANAEKTQSIEIVGFTDMDDIDPVYFEQPYYLEPSAKSDKGFALLRKAQAGLMSLLKQTLTQLETSDRRTASHAKTRERAAWLH